MYTEKGWSGNRGCIERRRGRDAHALASSHAPIDANGQVQTRCSEIWQSTSAVVLQHGLTKAGWSPHQLLMDSWSWVLQAEAGSPEGQASGTDANGQAETKQADFEGNDSPCLSSPGFLSSALHGDASCLCTPQRGHLFQFQHGTSYFYIHVNPTSRYAVSYSTNSRLFLSSYCEEVFTSQVT